MIRLDKGHLGTGHAEVATVSNPGVVRNFRVQVREHGTSDWQMYSTFRRRAEAECCLASLQASGVFARLVDCDRCPTAL